MGARFVRVARVGLPTAWASKRLLQPSVRFCDQESLSQSALPRDAPQPHVPRSITRGSVRRASTKRLSLANSTLSKLLIRMPVPSSWEAACPPKGANNGAAAF
jgi:hypothetical protein